MKNTLIKVLSFMMALTMIVGCFSAITISAADECAHANATKGETVAPTCSEFGYTWYTCPDCGKTYKSDLVEPSTSHNPVEVPASEATCTSPALTAGVQCADCEVWITPQKAVDGKPALKHNFVKGAIVAKTCTEDAYRPYVCTRCGLTAAECKAAEDLDAAKNKLPEITEGNYKFVEGGKYFPTYANDTTGLAGEAYIHVGHKWAYELVAAPIACTTGSAKGTCEVCGATQTIEGVHVEAKAANKAMFTVYGDITKGADVQLGACNENASYWECKTCKKIFNIVKRTEKIEHAEQQIVVTNGEPTVIKNGETTPTLANNMLSFRQFNAVNKLPVTGAKNEDYYKVATCDKDGYKVTYCQYCDTFTKTAIAAAHTWGAAQKYGTGVVSNDATKDCIEKVVWGRKCTIAGCDGFEAIFTVSEAVTHTWKGETTPADCVNSGYITYTCENENCTATYKDYPDTLIATGHKWNEAFSVFANDGTELKADEVDCTKGFYIAQKCSNKGCTEINATTKKVYAATTHDVPTADTAVAGAKKHTVPANCAEKGYTYYACKNEYCAYYIADEAHMVPNSETAINPNNHKNTAADNRLAGDSREVAATCTTNAKYVYHCAGCDKEKLVEVENSALGHLYTQIILKSGATARGDNDVNVLYNVERRPATCQKAGQTEGAACTRCRVVLKGAVSELELSLISAANKAQYTKVNDEGVVVYKECETITFDHEKAVAGHADHKHVKTASKTKDVAATCMNDAYTIYKFAACCGMTYNVVAEDTQYTSCNNANNKLADGTLAWKNVPAAPPECDKAGAYAHGYCQLCGKVDVALSAFAGADNEAELTEKVVKNIIKTEDLTIPATGHTYDIEVEEDPATCYSDGHTAYMACACGAKNADYKLVRAHSTTKYYKFNEAVAPTCTTAGQDEGYYCSVCVAIEGTPEYDTYGAGKKVGTTYPNAKTGHDYETKWYNFDEAANKPKDCTKPYFEVKTCKDCGVAEMVTDSFHAAAKDHAKLEFPIPHNGITKEDQALNAGEFYACQGDSYTSNKCANCTTEFDIVVTGAAISHYYYVGETKTNIDITCANIAKFDGVKCALCKEEVIALDSEEDFTVTLDPIKNTLVVGLAGSSTGITTDHDWDITYTVPTCTSKGVKIVACADCGLELVNEVAPALSNNHNPYVVDANGAINYGENFDNFNRQYVLSAGTPVKPTMTTDGYVEYRCAVCHEDVKYVIPALSGVAFGLDVTEAEAKKAYNGGKFNATITVSATNFKFNEFKFDIAYTSGIVATGAEVVYDFADGVYHHVEVVDNGTYATVIVAISNDNATKAPTAAVVSGDKVALVNVEFEVLEYAAGAKISAGQALTSVLNEKGEVVVLTKDSVDPSGNPIQVPDEKEITFTNAAKAFATIKAGDYNGDGDLTAADTAMIDSAIKSDEYIDILDFDGDEAITLNDYVALLRFRGSKQTYGDYLELINVDYNDFVKSYNLIVDLDGDKTVTDNDYALISLKLGNKLYSTSLTAAKSINAMIDEIVTGSVGK